MTKIKKQDIENAIIELAQYSIELDIDFDTFNKSSSYKTFKEFLYKKRVDEIMKELLSHDIKEYSIDKIVFEKDEKPNFIKNNLLLEWQQYKKIPKTRLTYRYDTGNTNTKTKDHIHVFQGKNQMYAINIDGSKHDGSKAKLGSKEVKFLKTIGFTPPTDGILEWITLDNKKEYVSFNYDLLLD